MVLRELFSLAITVAIDAAVSDLCDDPQLLDHQKGGHRRAHPFPFRIELGEAEDHIAGGLDRALEEAPHGEERIFCGLIEELFDSADAAADETINLFDRLGAGDLALGVSTDAIGDDVEAKAIIGEKAVFIKRPTSSDV